MKNIKFIIGVVATAAVVLSVGFAIIIPKIPVAGGAIPHTVSLEAIF
jgi:hypothetical protein